VTLDLTQYRRFSADEIEAVCKLQTRELVEAFATVAGIRTRLTPDADPRRVYHNIAVAIDPSRQLFNGQPGTIGTWIDALGLASGARVLHVGCGLGYYTAVMACAVGQTGRVVAFEVDEALATEARQNRARRRHSFAGCVA
jgi:protein-L-isoaspartate(D-aspartate) O-methyltransferase